MKKLLLPLILLALAAPVVIVSCSKSDDSPTSSTSSTASTASTATTSTTSTTTTTTSTSSTSTPSDSQSFTLDGTKYEIAIMTCQKTAGSADTYYMNGLASNNENITVTFHKEPTVAKNFTITTNGGVTTDTTMVQVKMIVASGTQTFLATGGTLSFGYDAGRKKVSFSNVTFVKTGSGSKIGSANYHCD